MHKTPLDEEHQRRHVDFATSRARKTAKEPVTYLPPSMQTPEYIHPPAGFHVVTADNHKLATVKKQTCRTDAGLHLDALDRRARVKARVDQGWSVPAIAADIDEPRSVVENDIKWLAAAARTVLARSVESLRDQALTRHQEEIDDARAALADPLMPAGARVSLRRLIRDLLNDRNAMLGLDKADPVREDLASRTAAMLARANDGDAKLGYQPPALDLPPEPDDHKEG